MTGNAATTGRLRKSRLFRATEWLLSAASFEWLLTRFPNGGTIILVRALLIAIAIYLSSIGLQNAFDPSRTWRFSGAELMSQVSGTLHWFGAILGAVYAALYTRFSSQWGYLADVYNQIKAAECSADCKAAPLTQWKAGFIEDAEDLHLATKRTFASVIRAWGRDEAVSAEFAQSAPGGSQRFAALMQRVNAAWDESGSRWREPPAASVDGP